MTSNKDLIQKLREIQEQQKLTDRQMADKLGCTRQLYQATKTGKIPVGLTILRGATRAFPEVIGDAIIFLTGDANIRAETADIHTAHHQTHQDGILGGFGRWLISSFLKTAKAVLRLRNRYGNQRPTGGI